MIDWKSINTVLLDMDGTLLDLHFDSHFWLEHLPRRYAKHHKLERSSIETDLIAQIMAEQGRLNWYSLDYWSNRFDLDIPALKREIQHLIGFRVDALDFLQWLKIAHPRVVLATNADRKSLDLKLPLTGLDQYVDLIYSSSDVGIPKEDQGYWHALMEIEPFNPATTLLIDDNESVLSSAQEFGIAQLITISQPDSQSPQRQTTEFPAITNFSELQLVNKL